MNDPRIGSSVTHYDSCGRVEYVEDAAASRTAFTYDTTTGRRLTEENADGKTTRYAYNAQGQTVRTWGDTAYPVSYEFDQYGRMTNMATYRDGSGWNDTAWPSSSAGIADNTYWIYDEGSGLLQSKRYADGKGPDYTYSTDGKLLTRTWARTDSGTITTTYVYTNTGEMVGIDYSDGTPDVTFSYDRMGRQVAISDGSGSRTLTYDGFDLIGEAMQYSDGTTNLLVRHIDSMGRSAGLDFGADYSVRYIFDAYGRFAGVTSTVMGVTRSFSYSRLANSELLNGLTEAGSGFTITRSFEDHRNLITQVGNGMGTNVISQFDYGNDVLGRRTSVKHSGSSFEAAGNAFNLYGYNNRSELIEAKRYFGTDLGQTNTPVLGQQFGYLYDNIGNRLTSAANGREASYTPNQLNQYTVKTVPGYVDVLGTAKTSAYVTVNNQAATRQGNYYYKELTVTNISTNVYPTVEVVGVSKNAGTGNVDVVMTKTGQVFVAGTPESFTHDDDGNLVKDGRFDYTWDGENRLVSVTTRDDLSGNVPRQKVEMAYDQQGRRVMKKVSDWNDSTWDVVSSNRFVYDGWNLVCELNNSATGDSATNYYAWGLDLSGSLQGAGGIGGLLSMTRLSTLGTNGYLYCFDANGNVAELMQVSGSTSQVMAAHFEYDPYGKAVVAYGDPEVLADNPYRFSTKYWDAETELLYYGSRFYNPGDGRWLNRDPIDENGGVNLCGFTGNDLINAWDAQGEGIGKVPPPSDPGWWKNLKPPSCPFPPCNKLCLTKGACEGCCAVTMAACSAANGLWYGTALAGCTELSNPWAVATCLLVVTENLIFAQIQLALDGDSCMLSCPMK